MLRLSPRAGLGLAALAASAATLTLAQPPPPIQPPSEGQPASPSGAAVPKRGDILDFSADGSLWHWLVQAGEEVEILTGHPDERATRLSAAAGLTEIALDEQSVWLLQRQGARGALLKLARTGGTPVVELSNLAAPAGLCVVGRRVFWIETHAPAVPGLLNIPAAEARNVVRVREEDGTVRDLGTMVGGRPAANGDLQGMADQICARLRRIGSTEFYLADLRQPGLRRAAVEEGTQQALLDERGLVWTAPSEEASDPTALRCLRRAQGNGSSATVTDWLPAHGQLLRRGSDLLYASLNLHRIPDSGEPVYVADLPPGEVTTDGERVVVLDPKSGPKSVSLNAPKP